MQLDYTPEGLMTGLTDPDGNPSTFGYADGRLTSVLGPGSSGDSLARTEIPPGTGSNGGFEVVHTTAEGVQTSYQVEVKTTGDEQRTTVMPDGTQEVLLKGMDGTSERTASDGTIQATAEGPDPRFGMQSPVQQDVDITTPDGLSANVTSSRQVTEDAATPPSLLTQTDTVSVNGRPIQRVYDASARTYTDTSPEGRQVVTTLDSKGRVIETQQSGLHPVRQSYDIFGRVNQLKYGPDPDTAETRTTTIDYVDDFDVAFEAYPTAAEGEIKTITDAAGRTTRFEYDAAARVTSQVLPDGSAIEIHYDQDGNVTSDPPSRPPDPLLHLHGGQPAGGLHPAAGEPAPHRPRHDLHLHRRPAARSGHPARRRRSSTITTMPPAGSITLTLLPANETHDYVYDPTTGNLAQIVTPQATLEMSYDGSLPTGEAWSGAELTAASVTRGYDASFRLQSQQIAVGRHLSRRSPSPTMTTTC